MKFLPRTPLSFLITFVALVFCITCSIFVWKEIDFRSKLSNQAEKELEIVKNKIEFPVSVDPARKLITEDPLVEWYVRQHLSINPDTLREDRLIDRIFARLSEFKFYQQLASPLSRILVIYPGQRKEEIANAFGDIMGWDLAEKTEFISAVSSSIPEFVEGKFFPGHYIVAKNAKPNDVAVLLLAEFNEEVVTRYADAVAAKVPLHDALVIASLLEREAYDFTDMRIISGIIWNRLFISMPLQLDATLQYAKGSKLTERKWWPKIVPSDKFIDSPFNTYEESGLPPTAIANPSVAAIVAALNPRSTTCLFYFHTDDGTFYCSDTYKEHVAQLKKLYGQGK